MSKLTAGGLDALKVAMPEFAPFIEGAQVGGGAFLTIKNIFDKVDKIL